MLQRPERWLSAHWRWRVASWLVASALVYGAAQTLMADFFSSAEGPAQMRAVLHAQLRTQQAAVRLQADTISTDALPAPAVAPFSVLSLSRDSHSTLVSWLPGTPHSTLTLEVSWPQLPTLLALLGRQNIAPTGLTLQMRERVLTLTLRLEETQ